MNHLPDRANPLQRPSRRISDIKATLLNTPYSICLERPALLQKFKQSPEGREARKAHPLVRRAHMLAYILCHRRPKES